MHFVCACIAKHQLRILSDFRGIFLKRCFPSSWRCYGVASSGSLMRSRHAQRAVTAAQSLHISRCTIHSDAVTEIDSTGRTSSSASGVEPADCDSLGSEDSNLHIPVLTKEVVNLIAPVKGQVGMFDLCFC